MSTIETSGLMTVGEAASFLRLSRATTYRLIDRGELPAHRVGGKTLRVDRDELREWLSDSATREDSNG